MNSNLINLQSLPQTSDDDLYNFLWETAADLYITERPGEKKEDLRIFLAVHNLEAEVCNGGFDQFFYNHGFEYTPDCLIGLEKIGALLIRQLLEKAIHIHEKYSSEYKNERNPMYDPLDAEFYKLIASEYKGNSKLKELMIAFVRENPTLFLSN